MRYRSSSAAFVLPIAFCLAGNIATAVERDTGPIKFAKRKLLVGPYESCAVADINRDGHLDIVYGAYWFAGPDFLPHAIRTNHTSSEYMRANSDHVYDVDGDGWLDVIAGGWNEDGIYWYKNPGNGPAERGAPWEMHLPWKAHRLAKTRGSMEMFALHDYDSDGVPELHSACYRAREPLEVWRFSRSAELRRTNSGDDVQGEVGAAQLAASTLKPFVLGREGGGHGFAFGDVNGDGREDVLCEVGWYERPAGDPFGGPWKYHPETDLTRFHTSCPFVVKDLTGDGRLDIIFGRGHAYGLYWWEQLDPKPDGPTQWQHHVIDESWSQAHCLKLADIDGDGQDDLIAGKCIWAHNGDDPGAADPPVIYYYTWDSATRKFTRHTIADRDEHIALGRQFAVEDLNADGRLDLVAPSKTGLWVLINQGAR
jgi:hypothetical protein